MLCTFGNKIHNLEKILAFPLRYSGLVQMFHLKLVFTLSQRKLPDVLSIRLWI